MSDTSRVRVSIVGIIVVVLFSTLLARLWFLQSGSENSLKVQAIAETTKVVQTESPRGEILDRNGKVLVKDRAAWAVTVDRGLSTGTATRVLGQLAEQLGKPVKELTSQYNSKRQSPLKPAVVAVDVSQPARLAIMQDPQDYPGVHVMELTVREYPQGELASQLLGYVGEVPNKKPGYQAGDDIGLSGAEAAFEKSLRGVPRQETIEVDPTGAQVGAPVKVRPGRPGDDVYLTIDANVQKAAEDSLSQGIVSARSLQDVSYTAGFRTLKAPAGAVVVLDADDGSVVADASYPSYPLDWWVGGISTKHYDSIQKDNALINLATQGMYAPGSTFKLVTSLAMTKYGIRGIGDYYDDQGQVALDGTVFHNAQQESFGPVNLQQALTVSSDAYFYKVGDDFWHIWKNGDPKRGMGIQTEARELGFGAATGFELDEASGLVTDPKWVKDFADANYKTKAEKESHGTWYPFDDIFPAVGQGDLQVTPLQLANAYAAFANDGTLWHPRLADKIVPPDGKPETFSSKPIRHISLDPTTRAAMLAGFQGAISDPKGTAYQSFQGFPISTIPVAGKTGTAQVAGKGDTSLFVAMFGGTIDRPQYVVAVVVEQAGFGAQTAAPIARRIIETMTGQPAPPVVAIDQGHD
jgi:penicillin-binding protein 2